MFAIKFIKRMKIAVLVIFAVMVLLSCNRGRLVDERKSDDYRYSLDKSKIYYRIENAQSIWRLGMPWDNKWIQMDDVDVKSFEIIKVNDDRFLFTGDTALFSKDKYHYFYMGKALKNIDYATFIVGDNGLIKDKNHVYHCVNPEEILPNANPRYFKRIIFNDPDIDSYWWSKDDKHYFMSDSIIDVDYATFKILTSSISIDKNFIYRNFSFAKFAPSAPITKYVILNDMMMMTDKYVYNIQMDDSVVVLELPVKDTKTVKVYSGSPYFRVDDKIYWINKEVKGADVNSFEVLKNAAQYAKDKNHVYSGDCIVGKADPKTARYNDKEDRIEDQNYIWVYSNEMKKFVPKRR